MDFTINNNLVFIDSMEFMNSNLNKLVKSLSDNDFKNSSQEFGGDLLQLVKKKGVYPYEYMESFKKFLEDKLPDRSKILVLQKMNILVKKNIYMLLLFEIRLKWTQWVIIMTFI